MNFLDLLNSPIKQVIIQSLVINEKTTINEFTNVRYIC